MSTQQDIYAAGSENQPPMLNKENYVPWSSRLLGYAKSRPNGKLIHNSIIKGPYVRRMIPELDIYVAVDSCETAQEIWLRVQQMIKGSNIGIQEKKAKLFNGWERFTSNDGESIESYSHQWSRHVTIVHQTKDLHIAVPHQDQPSFNQNYMQQRMPNPEDIINPTTAMNMALALMAKAFKLNYLTPTNNNQRISSNLRNRQIAQPGNANHNLNGNGNLVVARAEGNATGHNGNQIRCYNSEEWVVLLETTLSDQGEAMLLIFKHTADLDKIEEVNAKCILMANLQQASTSGTQTDKSPVYNSDGSAEYTELLEPIPKSHQVPQNDNNVISEVTSVEQSEETVEQHSANVEETRVLYYSLYQNLAIEVEKVYTVNRKLKETNAELTTELARFKNQEKCF
nr:hypothetical protein [Tanacetum cinerariifolium]